ncbi:MULTISPECIES: O-antigen ligase family protein [unclassified Vibrio]|uniref:O-antigen ligase family protein n=1 Tax=unclassified Vibrio TaxID=2614977 RepID=UPI0035527653
MKSIHPILIPLLYLPIIWAFSGLFSYSDSYKVAMFSTIIAALSSAYLFGFKQICNWCKRRRLLPLFALAATYAVLSKEMHGYNNNEMRGLLTLLILGIFTPSETLIKIRDHIHWPLLTLSLIGLFYMIYNAVYLNIPREVWNINPIPYSTAMSAAACLSLYHSIKVQNNTHRLIMLLAFVLYVFSIFLSGTRGALLSLSAVSTLILASFLITNLKSGTIFLCLALCTTLIASSIFKDTIENRYNYTISEIKHLAEGNLSSSIGLRLQMYNAALQISTPPKLLGYGTDNFSNLKESLNEQGLISKTAARLNSFHNQFLHNLVIYGFIGVFITLLWFIYPIYIAWKNENIALAPVLIVGASYFTSAMTDVPLQKIYSLVFFGVLLLLLLEEKPVED